MDKVQQIPLAERLQSAGARSMGLPVAMGLYAEDFIGLVGQMTGREEHYTDVYATHIKPYEGEDDGKSVRNMVVAANTLPPEEKRVSNHHPYYFSPDREYHPGMDISKGENHG